ncbi:MAG: hypothetical protein ACLUNQ_05165 [Oscillospiraceae bacterium]
MPRRSSCRITRSCAASSAPFSVRLAQSQQHSIDICTRQLRQMQEKRVLTDPMAFLQDRAVQLDYTRERLASALERILEKHTRRFTHAAASLDAA